eukprot:g451.t1
MKLVFTLVLFIAFNYAVTVESDKNEINEMLEDRATLTGGQGASETSSLLQQKNFKSNAPGDGRGSGGSKGGSWGPVFPKPITAMMQQKKAGGRSVCKLPVCPTAPIGCSFSSSDEKDKNGCLKYPCGIDLVCDSGKTYKPVNARKGKALNDCVKNKDSKKCKSVCKNAMTSEDSFIELMTSWRRRFGGTRKTHTMRRSYTSGRYGRRRAEASSKAAARRRIEANSKAAAKKRQEANIWSKRVDHDAKSNNHLNA